MMAWMPFLQSSIGNPNFFNGYLILGYVVMGVISLAYIASLAVRQRNLQQDIRLMQQILQDDENGDDL
ncbi:MAG: hypothetical protein KC419_11365 [Anaerolineales bacterium]|nr:hypothetical protein [Anaerolineales bacterium]MCA9929073.1 hypothetical protein [Anaerolineales bacterium]